MPYHMYSSHLATPTHVLPLPLQPLVGHNMLLDLAFMFQKFHRDLPPSYRQFKEELHRMFPIIVDTKQLCFSLRQVHVGLLCSVCGVLVSLVCVCLKLNP